MAISGALFLWGVYIGKLIFRRMERHGHPTSKRQAVRRRATEKFRHKRKTEQAAQDSDWSA
ncbi:hypothetical protein SBA1_1060002 [Candidatus Sulfotelmatobacter kueseliae]|uniref:Uncharacterized protein n=1 Tax=Candidatus Sulfotelmatobacter kueseliae TaxID=2042962 RepID=A0A2U3JZ91_9BACT|nr:hypothetical protein SBA1_1060002 [Candidatus Sulfotelmatobacter kueseliae]